MAASTTNTTWSRRSGNAFEPASARIDRPHANDLPPLRVAFPLVGDVVLTALPGDRHISMWSVTLLRSTIGRPGAIPVAGRHDAPAAAFVAARVDPREKRRARIERIGHGGSQFIRRPTTKLSRDVSDARHAFVASPFFTESMARMCAHTHIRVDGLRDKLSYVYAQKLPLEAPQPTSSAGANAYSPAAAAATAPVTGSRPAEAAGSNISTKSPR